MNTIAFGSALPLARGQVLRLGALRGTRLECRRGALWLTFDHDRRDLVLEAGQVLSDDSPAEAMVQAILGPAELVLHAPQREAA
jgi:hypothetical protein